MGGERKCLSLPLHHQPPTCYCGASSVAISSFVQYSMSRHTTTPLYSECRGDSLQFCDPCWSIRVLVNRPPAVFLMTMTGDPAQTVTTHFHEVPFFPSNYQIFRHCRFTNWWSPKLLYIYSSVVPHSPHPPRRTFFKTRIFIGSLISEFLRTWNLRPMLVNNQTTMAET